MLLPIVVDLIGQRLAHKRGKSSKTVDAQGSICEERRSDKAREVKTPTCFAQIVSASELGVRSKMMIDRSEAESDRLRHIPHRLHDLSAAGARMELEQCRTRAVRNRGLIF